MCVCVRKEGREGVCVCVCVLFVRRGEGMLEGGRVCVCAHIYVRVFVSAYIDL